MIGQTELRCCYGAIQQVDTRCRKRRVWFGKPRPFRITEALIVGIAGDPHGERWTAFRPSLIVRPFGSATSDTSAEPYHGADACRPPTNNLSTPMIS